MCAIINYIEFERSFLKKYKNIINGRQKNLL